MRPSSLPLRLAHRRAETLLLRSLEGKDGGMGEDEQKKLHDQIQKMTDTAIAEIDQMLSLKEAEIIQV